MAEVDIDTKHLNALTVLLGKMGTCLNIIVYLVMYVCRGSIRAG